MLYQFKRSKERLNTVEVCVVFETSNGVRDRYGREQSRDCLGLYGQVNKRIRWMPWRQEAMKDVVACEKLRGAGKQALIRRCPNGETHP